MLTTAQTTTRQASGEATLAQRLRARLALPVIGAPLFIVYTRYFTGAHCNYLKSSIANAGLDPSNLPGVDKTSMNFGTGRGKEAGKKPWKDIWGAGQGVGSIDDAPPARGSWPADRTHRR
jgi:nitronate monooxygenase